MKMRKRKKKEGNIEDKFTTGHIVGPVGLKNVERKKKKWFRKMPLFRIYIKI